MIYIYHDFGGTHTTSLAAAYHLNLISGDLAKKDKEEILSVPYFNKLDKKDAGKLIFHGEDEEGALVYTIGRRRSKLVIPAMYEMSIVLKEKGQLNERIIFSDTSPVVPLAMTLGGLFSRELKIDAIGIPLLVKGAQQCGDHILQLVEKTKKRAKENARQEMLSIENMEFQA